MQSSKISLFFVPFLDDFSFSLLTLSHSDVLIFLRELWKCRIFRKFVFMNRFLWILMAIVAWLGFVGCGDEPELPGDRRIVRARRTILVYMAAQNNLSSNVMVDIGEMTRAEIPADCRLVVFCSTYNEQPKLMEVTSGGLVDLKTYPQGTIGADAETLRQVLVDARQLAPSVESAVVFWSHSTGWKGAQRIAPAARTFGLEDGRQIELTDLADALRAVPKLDFIFFDSCYMGCVEVAYELRDVADYMVASVCEVPFDGMPYDRTIPHLFDADMVRGLTAAIDANVDYYIASPGEGCPSTLALVDLSAMDALAAAAAPILADPQEPDESFQYFSTSTTFKDYFVDLRRYMELVSPDDALLVEFNAALDRAVIHERHTSMIWKRLPIVHCSGLSINPNPSAAAFGYQNLAWRIDTKPETIKIP